MSRSRRLPAPAGAGAQHRLADRFHTIAAVFKNKSSSAMPCKIVWEPEGVYRRLFGDVTLAQRRSSIQAISTDRRFDQLRYAITDYLDVDGYESTPESTAEIAAMHIGPLFTNPRLLIIAVVIHDFMRHGFTQAPYRVFATLDEGRAWVAGQLA